MRFRRIQFILVVAALLIAACTSPGATTSPSSAASSAASASADASTNPEAVIDGVEEGAEITFWTFFLSPTFDEYIEGTIARFEETYPGVTVNWEDHQATFLDDYRNAINAGTQPDVANLSNNEGWVREFAEAGRLLNLSDNLPQAVIDQYFPNLFMDSLVDGSSYQVPWYQAIPVEIVNTEIFEAAGLSVEDFPDSFEGIPELCQTIKDETGKLCDIRLTVNDYLAQMTYEGGVEVINEDGTEFTFDSAEAVEWLQTYVDMVEAGTVDRTALTTADDRVALELFTSGEAPFYQTGPQLIREVKESNPALYEQLAIAPFPIGRAGVIQPTSQGIAVKADTEFPNAAMALAAFFTNPISQLEFSQIVPIYPSTPASYEDSFFTEEPELVEDSARPLAHDLIEQEQNILPTIPNKAEVNEIVRQAVEQALFNGADPQQALSDAVAQANEQL
ncbi:MAG: ABC transporter substrate-binding protein [Candidatus Limnocylindria bacterium]